MTRYRARLRNGRVIGPFDKEGIRELALKGHIDGTEEFQEFPTGDWAALSEFGELKRLVEEALLSKPTSDEATFVKKLSDLEAEAPKTSSSEESTNEVNEELFPKEFSYQMSPGDETLPGTVPTDASDELDEEDGGDEDYDEQDLYGNENDDLSETELYTKHEFKQEPPRQDKTIVSPATLKFLEEQKKLEAEKKKKEEEASTATKEEEKVEPEVDLNADSTQFIDLADLKEQIEPEIQATEKLLNQETKKYKQTKKNLELKKKKEKDKEDQEENESEQGDKKKKSIIVVAAALILIFLFLPEEKEKKTPKQIEVIYPQISFPQQYETPDENKAAVLYKKASLEYGKGTYVGKLKSAKLYRASLENKFKDNPAAGKLIFVYSELLKHSNTPTQDANRVFKLVQIFNTKAARDPDIAAAAALFYLNIGKAAAAVKTVEKFNTIKGSKPTLELFAVFLRALIENGELIKAKAVEEKLSSVESRPLFVQLSLFDYYLFKGSYEKAAEMLLKMEKKHADTVAVLLRKASLILYKEDFKSLAGILKKVRSLEAERSKVFYSKYLEYRGMLAAKNNRPAIALKAFKKALKLHESLELRSRLASLNSGSAGETGRLINESKAIKLIARAKSHWKKDNHKYAFKDALEAARIAPHYLPAKLYVTELQIKQSFFSEAISALEELYEKYPQDPKVVFSLINAYVEAYKFQKAQKLLSILGASELRRRPEYFSMMAKYYVFKDNFGAGVAWLQKALNLNPLNDENTYELAKMFIRYRKYKQGKLMLNKAMDLDPSRVDFRVSYADIVYETDGADAAIGYLYDVLRDFPDNAKILGKIGIYYYRSGQIKMFESTKEKLLALPDKDTALFEFLIKAAKMDEKYDDVIKYSKELIEINPGDLRARLFLGQLYMEMSKYKKALAQFNAIKERLDTYPKLQFYMSKLYLLTDNIDKAMELAKKEIKGNPGGVDGYILLGEILQKQEKYLEAETQFKKAQQINPKNVDVLVGLAYISFMKSQYEIALDLFKKAVRLEPGRSETHKLLGDVYRKIGQSALAVDSYKMFLELSPNSRYKQNLQNYINMMK